LKAYLKADYIEARVQISELEHMNFKQKKSIVIHKEGSYELLS